MGSWRPDLFLILFLSLVLADFSSMAYSTLSNNCCRQNEHCNSPMKVRRLDKLEDAAEHQANTTSNLHPPDTKVTSTPKIWKGSRLSYTTLLSHVHGVLNIIGWGTLIPIGIIIGRYFRDEYPISCDGWYSAHAVCQTCGYVMGIVGWGFGISLFNSAKRSHVPFLVLGIFVILLTTIQMVFALCVQPKKESGWRRKWEIYHHVMGYVIMALIIADIFEGINAQRHPKKWRWAYVGILSALALVAAALEIHRCIKLKLFKQAIKLNANMYTQYTTT